MNQKWNLQDIRPVDRTSRRNGNSLQIDKREVIDGGTTNPKRPLAQKPNVGDMRRPRFNTKEDPVSDFENDPEDIDLNVPNERIPVIDGNKRTRKHIIAAVVIFCLISGLGFTLSIATRGATVTVEPKTRSMNVNAEFTAYKEQKPEELSYEIITIEATDERQVSATGEEEVKTQATGEIEITKTTPGAERLIKNTRFATADGLIFRIEESVVVPGAVTKDDKTIPGTIRAKVFADEAGDKYNLPVGTKLLVPGFKEGNYMDLYTSISAVNTSAFTNGFSGPRFIINEEELASARQSLQTTLRDSLLKRIETEKPAGVTMFKGAIAITYTQLPAVQYGENLVTIKEQASLQIPIFKQNEFASYLAKETIVGYEGEGVRIGNIDTLTFNYLSATTSQSNIANLDSLNFKISGVPQIIWTFDEGKLKLDLLGAEKTAIPQIISSYKGIEKSEVKIRPVWRQTMPDALDEITVIEKLSAGN